jgi:hypothetical protein
MSCLAHGCFGVFFVKGADHPTKVCKERTEMQVKHSVDERRFDRLYLQGFKRTKTWDKQNLVGSSLAFAQTEQN